MEKFKNIFIQIFRFFKYDLRYGIRNLFLFFNVIWKWRSFDFSFDLNILIKMYEIKYKKWKNITYYYNAQKEAKDLKIVLEILKRINSSDLSIKQYNDMNDLLFKKLRKVLYLWN